MSYVRENEEICVVFTVQVCKNSVLILGDALPLEVITIKEPLNMLRTDVYGNDRKLTQYSFDSSNSLSFSSYTITALDENIRQISLNTEEKPHHHISNLS